MMTEPEEQEQPPEDPNKMDYELFSFLIKIMRTIFIGMFWMLINIFLGLYLGFGVPAESTPGRLFFFYTWMTLTLIAYIYFIWRLWRKKMSAP
ncbi:hypothetical protein [Chitinophaga nivalis]|uniref:DUF4212 domain-containing protein n=1 Tax=Chitinophaga nivalis TaxID=2991709 RepID=A0ABT3IVD1_9BACT|nr:hypothetical protein [Chitinophaga nivalis]MCW3462371.1 hypothetical protein [Chitinophaga nivalis]MCW3487938.1 hypothetical protein [Chitinophaga nivalis]